MEKTIILLIRHGSTAWSEDDRFTGISNINLSEKGKTQALKLARRINNFKHKPTKIFSSPLLRCVETSTIIGTELNILSVEKNDAFAELNYGKWEGMTRKEIKENWSQDYAKWEEDPFNYATPNGESGKEVLNRVIPAFENLCKTNIGKSIILVAHKTVNRIILCSIMNIPINKYRNILFQYPACINALEYSGNNGFSVISLNDISHYSELLQVESNG